MFRALRKSLACPARHWRRSAFHLLGLTFLPLALTLSLSTTLPGGERGLLAVLAHLACGCKTCSRADTRVADASASPSPGSPGSAAPPASCCSKRVASSSHARLVAPKHRCSCNALPDAPDRGTPPSAPSSAASDATSLAKAWLVTGATISSRSPLLGVEPRTTGPPGVADGSSLARELARAISGTSPSGAHRLLSDGAGAYVCVLRCLRA